MEKIQKAGLGVLIIGLMVTIPCLWYATTIPWGMGGTMVSMGLYVISIWLTPGIILILIGIGGLVAPKLRKKK
ncbi:MAG: hypothetical protein JSV62_13235 [Promethearchaeota archaeon]|nr:MAG: hypothetical protein JSV62_13235 [Candidatus Lokiarchaeota archaeon]